ncbi:MAG: hypothetical protein F6K21_09020 [Symploca sp. SIO2D2]|nr:hypothetical protein [Symploca sp. SIO2D2]
MGQDILKEWFDDLSESLAWLSSLSIYCSASQQSIVVSSFTVVDQAVSDFVVSGSSPSDLQKVISSVREQIIECARKDIGKSVS